MQVLYLPYLTRFYKTLSFGGFAPCGGQNAEPSMWVATCQTWFSTRRPSMSTFDGGGRADGSNLAGSDESPIPQQCETSDQGTVAENGGANPPSSAVRSLTPYLLRTRSAAA